MSGHAVARTAFSSNVTRREALRRLGALGAGLLWAGSPTQGATGGTDTVRVGLWAGGISSWPVLRAAAAGHFEKAGLRVEVDHHPDAQSAARALVAGVAEAAVLPTPLFCSAHVGAGAFAQNRRPLATFQVAVNNGSALLVPPGSDIHFSRQFGGKTIGIEADLGVPKILTDVYLQLSGLDPAVDVFWTVLRHAQLRQTFVEGRVDGLIAGEWLAADLVRAGEARVVEPLLKLWADHPAEVLAVRRDFAESRGEITQRFAGATLRAAKDLAEGGFEGLPGAAAWQGDPAGTKARFDPFPYPSAMEMVVKAMKRRGDLPPGTDPGRLAEEVCLTDVSRFLMKDLGFADVPAQDRREERVFGCCSSFL